MANRMKSVLRPHKKLFAASYLIRQQVFHPQHFNRHDERTRLILKDIQERGFFVIPNFVDKAYCKECIKDIDAMMQSHREFVQQYSDDRIFGSEHLSSNIMKFARNEYALELANKYNTIDTDLGFTLANVIKYSNASSKLGSGGGWHRDSVNRQFKAILYLNDVTEENGAYQIIEGSHKLGRVLDDIAVGSCTFDNVRYDDGQIDKIIQKNPERLKTITGNAGTAILKDCSAIHRGSPLKEGARYALTNYYFYTRKINSKLHEHFAPVVAPETTLK